jgi:CubicO group peptidase (beta-lactamase class C family)
MAKFGFLYLHNGNWNGTQLIPSSWAVESTSSFQNVDFDKGHGTGYGYKWWIYKWANAYTARGSYEQYITIIPDLNLVVVSTGNADFQFIRLLVNYILPSAGFYPNLNQIVIISLSFSLTALAVVAGFFYYRFHKKRKLLNKSN